MNHKWVAETEMVYGTKPHHCAKCGINKEWHGGDYQVWKYFWSVDLGKNSFDENVISTVESWKRPNCKSK